MYLLFTPFILIVISVFILAGIYQFATGILNLNLPTKTGELKKLSYGSALIDVVIVTFLTGLISELIPTGVTSSFAFFELIIAAVIYTLIFGLLVGKRNFVPKNKKIGLISILVISAVVLLVIRFFIVWAIFWLW